MHNSILIALVWLSFLSSSVAAQPPDRLNVMPMPNPQRRDGCFPTTPGGRVGCRQRILPPWGSCVVPSHEVADGCESEMPYTRSRAASRLRCRSNTTFIGAFDAASPRGSERPFGTVARGRFNAHVMNATARRTACLDHDFKSGNCRRNPHS